MTLNLYIHTFGTNFNNIENKIRYLNFYDAKELSDLKEVNI